MSKGLDLKKIEKDIKDVQKKIKQKQSSINLKVEYPSGVFRNVTRDKANDYLLKFNSPPVGHYKVILLNNFVAEL